MSERRVTVVDYGAGNLLSVCRALEHVGATVDIAEAGAAVARAERLVLPGVGAFGKAMEELHRRELVEPIRRLAQSGRPLMGICLGMQLLFDESEEFGQHTGLGLIGGRVAAIPATGADGKPHKIPHIGWSALMPGGPSDWAGTVLGDVAPGSRMYFVHSFTVTPADPGHRLAVADYDGRTVTAAVACGNVSGFQPHPEKSAGAGLAILARFAGRS